MTPQPEPTSWSAAYLESYEPDGSKQATFGQPEGVAKRPLYPAIGLTDTFSPTQQESASSEREPFSPDRTLCFAPAIPLEADQVVEGLSMPGEGEAKPSCMTVKGWISCPNVAEPFPSTKQTTLGSVSHGRMALTDDCHRISCPYCGKGAMHRMAQKAAESVEAAHHLFKCSHRARHFSFSPPQAQAVKRMKALGIGTYLDRERRQLYDLLKRNGMKGGQVVFHPWRCSGHGEGKYRNSQRHLAPHFHVVGFGKFTNSTTFHETTEWVVKNHDAGRRKLRDMQGLFATFSYLLDHAGVVTRENRSKTDDMVRPFGIVHQVKVVREERFERPYTCPCGSICWRYEDRGGIEGEAIELGVEVWVQRTYARHKRAKAPPGAPDEWTNTEPPDTSWDNIAPSLKPEPMQDSLIVAAGA